jgi:hypothetical protein
MDAGNAVILRGAQVSGIGAWLRRSSGESGRRRLGSADRAGFVPNPDRIF